MTTHDEALDRRRTDLLRLMRHTRTQGEGAATSAKLVSAVTDPDPGLRRAAADAAGFRQDHTPALAMSLVRMLETDDVDHCREAAAFALGEIGGERAVSALVTATATETSPLVREAIVAALGAIGDPETAAVVAAMTRGEKPAVRRRAVVACAGFDSPEADGAIRAALEDRDRHVRDAAAWILRPPC
ncbi:MAG: HEAT repeat domain-containing protein [Acidimicrobiia bacterium]|nr:HEAT repeat domain-containing protein [Acidimicrobiia bacterium]